MDNKTIEEKEKEYAHLMFEIRRDMIWNDQVTDAEIWEKICETPEIIPLRDRSSGSNFFIEAVLCNRRELAEKLAENGADILYESNCDLEKGNALNVAKTPEMAEWLLSLGLKPEKNLIQLISERPTPFNSPAIMAVEHNDPLMLRYWLTKCREIFADDADYPEELFQRTIHWANTWQGVPDVWLMLLADDEIYSYLKKIFSTEQDPDEIKGFRRVLKNVENEALSERKAELAKTLSRTKKKAVPVDKIKLVKHICNGIKSALKEISEKYKDEEVYILSVEVDQCNKSFFVYVNTEENHVENLKQACDDPWYYRFCENEWYILENSPNHFSTATKYLKSIDDQIEIDEIYECVVTALDQLRRYGFISKAFGRPVFLTVNASVVVDEEGMIDIAKIMNYRKANSDEHNIICKQVRSRSVLTVCLSALVIPVVILASCLSVNMMIRQRYDKAAFVISIVMLVVFFVAVVVAMIWLMSGFIKRISCINKQNYSVADCVVEGRKLTTNPKHNHSFVTVSFPDGSTQQAMVSQKVYDLAENGKRALLIKYDEPEGKEKLPFEIAVL